MLSVVNAYKVNSTFTIQLVMTIVLKKIRKGMLYEQMLNSLFARSVMIAAKDVLVVNIMNVLYAKMNLNMFLTNKNMRNGFNFHKIDNMILMKQRISAWIGIDGYVIFH